MAKSGFFNMSTVRFQTSVSLVDVPFGDSYRLITETAHSLGMKIMFHSCGNTYSFL